MDHQSQGVAVYISKEETNMDFSSCHQSFLSQKEENFVQFSVPFWTQFYVLFVRTIKSILRDHVIISFSVPFSKLHFIMENTQIELRQLILIISLHRLIKLI